MDNFGENTVPGRQKIRGAKQGGSRGNKPFQKSTAWCSPGKSTAWCFAWEVHGLVQSVGSALDLFTLFETEEAKGQRQNRKPLYQWLLPSETLKPSPFPTENRNFLFPQVSACQVCGFAIPVESPLLKAQEVKDRQKERKRIGVPFFFLDISAEQSLIYTFAKLNLD